MGSPCGRNCGRFSRQHRGDHTVQIADGTSAGRPKGSPGRRVPAPRLEGRGAGRCRPTAAPAGQAEKVGTLNPGQHARHDRTGRRHSPRGAPAGRQFAAAVHVLPAPRGVRRHVRGNFRNTAWLPAIGRLGLDGLRPHDLRHTRWLRRSPKAPTPRHPERLGHAPTSPLRSGCTATCSRPGTSASPRSRRHPGSLRRRPQDTAPGRPRLTRRRRTPPRVLRASADVGGTDPGDPSATKPQVKPVGEGGLEPPHPFGHRNLNPPRLPIPPLARVEVTG